MLVGECLELEKFNIVDERDSFGCDIYILVILFYLLWFLMSSDKWFEFYEEWGF